MAAKLKARFGSSPAGDFTLEVRTPGSSDKIRAVYVDNAFYLQLGSSVPLPSGNPHYGLTDTPALTYAPV